MHRYRLGHSPHQSGTSTPELLVASNLVEVALPVLEEAICRAISDRGRCTISLAGGNTPLPLYQSLAKMDLPWSQVQFYWGDERFLAPTDDRSNARAAHEALLSAIPVPAAQVHAWPILASPTASAEAYAATLRRCLGDPPKFDVTLLGLGADCHTASLFPGTGDVARSGIAIATTSPSGEQRLSLSVESLSRSELVIFLVSGEEKQPALNRLLDSSGRAVPDDDCPARSLGAQRRLLVITDLA